MDLPGIYIYFIIPCFFIGLLIKSIIHVDDFAAVCIGGIIYIVLILVFKIIKEKIDKNKMIEEIKNNHNKSRTIPPQIINKTPISNYPTDWNDIRDFVLKRDGYSCGNCGSSEDLHVHHIVPLGKGGSNNHSNLRTLCAKCHKKIHPFL